MSNSECGSSCPQPLAEIISYLEKVCTELRVLFGGEFKGLALFGSYARGEARWNSDVDVLVVFESLRGLDVRARVYNVLSKHLRKPITLVTATSRDLKVGKLTSLGINIGYDCIAVCDDEGVIREFSKRVREFVRRYKLVRYSTPDGKYGWKRVYGEPLARSLGSSSV